MTALCDNASAPVGLLDSGWGGLSVALEVRRALPGEDLVFAADCGFAPWGEKPDAFVLERIDAVVDFLIARGIKALVVACNTATSLAVQRLRERLAMPVVGIEPAVFPAVRETVTGTVAVLATPKTIDGLKYRALREEALRWAREHRSVSVDVIDVPAPGLMQCVERGDFATPETRALVRYFLEPAAARGADRIVLGCTHYPFLLEAIRECVPGAEPIDPAPAVARQLMRRLREEGLATPRTAGGTSRFFATDPTTEREAVLRTLWRASGETEPRLETLV